MRPNVALHRFLDAIADIFLSVATLRDSTYRWSLVNRSRFHALSLALPDVLFSVSHAYLFRLVADLLPSR
jgi:hypothetical protein